MEVMVSNSVNTLAEAATILAAANEFAEEQGVHALVFSGTTPSDQTPRTRILLGAVAITDWPVFISDLTMKLYENGAAPQGGLLNKGVWRGQTFFTLRAVPGPEKLEQVATALRKITLVKS